MATPRILKNLSSRVTLKTLYGIRNGNGMSFYEDKELKKFKCNDPYHYYLKSQIITINGYPFNMILVKRKK